MLSLDVLEEVVGSLGYIKIDRRSFIFPSTFNAGIQGEEDRGVF